MEVRSEPSFNPGFQNSPSSSPFGAVQAMHVDYIAGGGDSVLSQGFAVNAGERGKRKRGRPRKYTSPDGQTSLAPPSSLSDEPQPSGFATGFALSPATKKKKSKPQDSGKKHQLNVLGSSGIGFTPHVVTVKAGEDVSAKIMSFSNNGPRAVCILSANGAISSATVRQAGTPDGTAAYEGRYEILSLSGSILPTEGSEQCGRSGGLSVALAGPDGSVLGGGVAGPLVAATPVQVIFGSFIADNKRKERQSTGLMVSELPTENLSHFLMPEEPGPGPSPGPNPSPSPGLFSRGIMSERISDAAGDDDPYNQGSNGNDRYNGINGQGLPAHWN